MPNRRINLSKFADQPNFVDASQLVKKYARTFAFEPHFWSAAQRLTGTRQWCDDDAWKFQVHVIGETTSAGRVFLISLPTVGSRLTQ